jgi:hypothetical protein
MSAWLRKARSAIDILADVPMTIDDRELVLLASRLVDEVEALEQAIGFISCCDEHDLSASALIGLAAKITEKPGKAITIEKMRGRYFRRSAELRRMFMQPDPPSGDVVVHGPPSWFPCEVAA